MHRPPEDGDRELLGRGRTAEVFRTPDGKVLKLFYEEISADLPAYEARIARAVCKVCNTAPAFYGVTQFDRRIGLIYECIIGTPLIESLLDQTFTASEVGRYMAQLHRRIHTAIGEGLPTMAEIFGPKIRQYSTISAIGKGRLMDFIHRDGVQHLCHGDLHLDNVLREEGHRLSAIDWTNGYSGNPLSDVARTHYMFLHGLPPGRKGIEPEERHIRGVLADAYWTEYFAENQPDTDTWDIWRLLALIRRSFEGIDAEQPVIEQAINQILQLHGDFA